MKKPFRWNDWNIDHIGGHGVLPHQVEELIYSARPPFPHYEGDGKWLVRGQDNAGLYLQAIFIYSPADVFYVIHARPLTDREKRQLRRRR